MIRYFLYGFKGERMTAQFCSDYGSTIRIRNALKREGWDVFWRRAQA